MANDVLSAKAGKGEAFKLLASVESFVFSFRADMRWMDVPTALTAVTALR